jgi:hypothetical protein
METMSSAPADGKGSLDMNQLNSMASNILKNMDTNKFQSVVSNMTGNNSNDNNGLSDMLGSIMSAMQNPVQNQPAQTPQGASAAEQKADFQGREAKQKNMMESILSTFKMPEGIMNTSAIGALNIGGGQGDLKNQFEAVLSSMKMDDAAKDKMRATLDTLMTKSMLDFSSLKNGLSLGNLNLQSLAPMLTSILGAMGPKKE